MRADELFKRKPVAEAVQQDVELMEVNMGLKALRKFANSPEADGIKIGFEAELNFRGLGGEGGIDYDADPEMDESEDRRTRSFSDIRDFFYDGDHNGHRDVDSLIEQLQEPYMEWVYENIAREWEDEGLDLLREEMQDDFSLEETAREILGDDDYDDEEIARAEALYDGAETAESEQDEVLRKAWESAIEQAQERFDEQVVEEWDEQGRTYERVREQFEDEHRDDYDEGDWLSNNDYDYMTDIYRNFDINWPYWTYPEEEGGWSDYNANRLANSLHDALDVPTKVSSGYHSARRDDRTWIFEPDSSLEPDNDDDMSVEIISPPMPIKEFMRILPLFQGWVAENEGYANESTGFHIGVSMPTTGGAVDYVKLALFLGDEHVLDKFGRLGNTYCSSAMKRIRQRIEDGSADPAAAMKLLSNNLAELASRSIETKNPGKYTSINVKPGYIEFRSPGGVDYIEMDNLMAIPLRFARAMKIASDPSAERREYAKKLYKLIDPQQTDRVMEAFANWQAGGKTTDELNALKHVLRVSQTFRGEVHSVPRDIPEGQNRYRITVPGMKGEWQVDAKDEKAAREIAVKTIVGLGRLRPNQVLAELVQEGPPVKPYTGPACIVYSKVTGEPVVGLNTDSKEEAWRMADSWVEQTGVRGSEYSVISAKAWHDITGKWPEITKVFQSPEAPQQQEYELINTDTGQVIDTFPAQNDEQALVRLSDYRNFGAGRTDPYTYSVRRARQPIPGSTLDLQRQRAGES